MLSSTFNLKNIDVKLGGKILCFRHAKTNAKGKKHKASGYVDLIREKKPKLNAHIDFKGNEMLLNIIKIMNIKYKYKRTLQFIKG